MTPAAIVTSPQAVNWTAPPLVTAASTSMPPVGAVLVVPLSPKLSIMVTLLVPSIWPPTMMLPSNGPLAVLRLCSRIAVP